MIHEPAHSPLEASLFLDELALVVAIGNWNNMGLVGKKLMNGLANM